MSSRTDEPGFAECLLIIDYGDSRQSRPEAARAKLDDYRSYVSEKGALVLMSGWPGVDLSRYRPDEPVRHSRQDAQTSGLARGGSREPRIVGHIYPEGSSF
jgi:hypothetical protein